MKEQNRTNETRSVGTTTDAMRRRDGTLTIYTEIFILHLNKRVTVQKSTLTRDDSRVPLQSAVSITLTPDSRRVHDSLLQTDG